MEDAYEVKITRTFHSFHTVNKTSSQKNNQVQDLTRADYLVQRPAFGHYFINNSFVKHHKGLKKD